MSWRGTQDDARRRYLAKYDAQEVDRYETWISTLTRDDEEACLDDIGRVFRFHRGMTVLDVGAGTGAMCKVLSRIDGLSLTALEPSPAMLAKLKSKPELRDVAVVQGFSDSESDREHFGMSSLDVIISRQLVNSLFDPLAAFTNWRLWLKPRGAVIVIEGLFDRNAWTGQWEEEIDILPISACRTIALVPYLLESAGFRIGVAAYMTATNARPAARTPRYMVLATKSE